VSTPALTLRDRLARIVEALPSGSAVTLPRDELARWIDAGDPEPMADYTVEHVAELLNRRPSTARGLCASGAIRAYKLNGREWRIPSSALREYLDRQANPDDDLDSDDDLSSWREL
jgi:excisionase family DNA binding protein